MVDELIGKQEVVIKSLGETFENVPEWLAEPSWVTAGWADSGSGPHLQGEDS